MTDEQPKKEKIKRFRSPPYPAFDLGKAVQKASELFSQAHHHAVGVSVLTEAWGMESASGKVWRHAAALIQYGLLSDSGSGDSRKFQITDIGRRIVQDTDSASEKRREALRKAALAPMIHQELWDKFGAAKGLSDGVLKTYLTTDRVDEGEAPYSGSAAIEVVATFRSTLDYAGLTKSDSLKVTEPNKEAAESDEEESDDQVGIAKVGDYVKWTSGGVDQFKARKVEWVSDDNSALRVFGSPTGIPMTQVEVVPAPRDQQSANTQRTPAADPTKSDISVYQVGGRLQITADVDADGVEKLEQLLSKYKEILKLLN